MTKTCEISIEGQIYKVCVSDEPEALLAAYAAGGAVLGVGEDCAAACPGIPVFIQSWDKVSREQLNQIAERLVCRKLGLPWIICRTERLTIREATGEDWEKLGPFWNENVLTGSGAAAFNSREELEAYISCQYKFYEYGLWVLEEKETGRMIGAAGVWNPEEEVCRRLKNAGELPEEYLEMGYQVFSPYQRRGFAREACRAVMAYTDWELECKLCLQIHPDNHPSLNLARSLGFRPLIPHTDTEETQWPYQFVWSC